MTQTDQKQAKTAKNHQKTQKMAYFFQVHHRPPHILTKTDQEEQKEHKHVLRGHSLAQNMIILHPATTVFQRISAF
jgi:hypothetical protein